MERKVVKSLPLLGTVKTVLLPVESGNPKVTEVEVRNVTKVVESELNGRRYLWPSGEGFLEYELIEGEGGWSIKVRTEAPFLIIKYRTGSWKKDYSSFEGLYDVAEGRWVFKLDSVKEDGRIGVEEYEEAQAEAVRSGYAISRGKAFLNTAAFYLLKVGGGLKGRRAEELIREAVKLVGLEKVKEILKEVGG